MIRQIILAAWLAVATATASHAQSGDETIPFANDDAVMNAAIIDAQKSLPLFLCTAVDAEGYGPADSYLKVRVPVKDPRMTSEVIWVGPFAAWDGRNFAGILVNEPVAMPGFALGDQLDFTYDMIVDWAWYHPNGANYGDYTSRVIYAQLGDIDALATLADPPYPPKWTCD